MVTLPKSCIALLVLIGISLVALMCCFPFWSWLPRWPLDVQDLQVDLECEYYVRVIVSGKVPPNLKIRHVTVGGGNGELRVKITGGPAMPWESQGPTDFVEEIPFIGAPGLTYTHAKVVTLSSGATSFVPVASSSFRRDPGCPL